MSICIKGWIVVGTMTRVQSKNGTGISRGVQQSIGGTKNGTSREEWYSY